MSGPVVIEGDSLNELLLKAAWGLSVHGRKVMRRGTEVMEFPGPVLFQLTSPWNNLCTLEERGLNPWTTLAEFPWILAGRNDIGWLLPYLPRAGDFSDDGETWRAGYGPRLRDWKGRIDQLAFVVDELTNNPESRRAVVTLWDPEEDTEGGSKDYPCTNWLHFQLREGKLECIVSMRSNDLIWGFSGVNVTNFTLLQMLVAEQLGVGVGQYYHLSSNLHLYPRHYDMWKRMLESRSQSQPYGAAGVHPYFGNATARVLEIVERHREAVLPVLPEHIPPGSNFFVNWVYFMRLHSFREMSTAHLNWGEALSCIPRDWALATARLLLRTGDQNFSELVRRLERA